MPWTDRSAFSRAMRSSSSFSGVDAGRSIWRDSIPASTAAFPLLRTYTWEAGSSPTRTTVSPGRTPARAASPATFSRTSARTDAAMAFPSISLAATRSPPYGWSSLPGRLRARGARRAGVASGGGARLRLLPLAGVVRGVPAAPLQVKRPGRHQALHLPPARGALRKRPVVHPLDPLDDRLALPAPVFVDGHGAP